MLSVLLAGGVVFYAIAFVVVLIVAGCVHNEKSGGAWVSLIVAAGVWWFLGGLGFSDSLVWIKANYLNVLGFCGGWVVLGAAWGCGFRWFRFVRQRLAEYKAELNFWLECEEKEEANAHITFVSGKVPDELKEKWRLKLLNGTQWSNKSYKHDDAPGTKVIIQPDPRNHKAMILNQAMLWPFDVVGFVIGDFLHDVWEWVYARMGDFMKWVAKMAVGNVDDDWTTKKQEAPKDGEKLGD